MAAYNVGIMHFTGVGTYQSCTVATTFIQHVANVGRHVMDLKEAYRLTQQNHVLKAALMYMELAEMGLEAAVLNSGLLLDQFKVFDASKTYLAQDVDHGTSSFDLNQYLAFNFFKMAVDFEDTASEAMLKVGDYYYYGFQPIQTPSLTKAAYSYKWVESNSKDPELRGQALFNLGMIYHFGSGWQPEPEQTAKLGVSPRNQTVINIDLKQAQAFYQKALKEESNARTPVYILYMYSKWQSIDLYETIVSDLLIDGIQKSRVNQACILLLFALYIGLLYGTVAYLRKDLVVEAEPPSGVPDQPREDR